MQIVVLGAGYGGLSVCLHLAAKGLGRQVTLVTDGVHHQLITQLHRVAAGTAKPESVLILLDFLLNGTGVSRKQGKVVRIEPGAKRVVLQNGEAIPYDRLVVAVGGEPETFGIPGVREYALPISPTEAAMRVRSQIEALFVGADKREDSRDGAKETEKPLRLAVVGGGLTGVEVAGEFADVLPDLIRQYKVKQRVEVVLVEAAPTILFGFAKGLTQEARRVLLRKGVVLREGVPITAVEPDGIRFQDGQHLPSDLVIWAGGVRGHRLVASAFAVNNRGRALVDGYLKAIEHPDVYLLGDTALAVPQGHGKPAAPSAQAAVLQAKVVAHNLWAECSQSGQNLRLYREQPLGSVVSIGRWSAAAALSFRKHRVVTVTGLAAVAIKLASEWRYVRSIGGWRLVYRSRRQKLDKYGRPNGQVEGKPGQTPGSVGF